MNYKAKYGDVSSGIKKVRHVSDVKSMGYPSAAPAAPPSTFAPNPYSAGSSFSVPEPNYVAPVYGASEATTTPNTYYSDPYSAGGIAAPTAAPNLVPNPVYGQQQPPWNPNNQQAPSIGMGAPSFSMLQQPIVQDMALQYGQKLADQGKQLVETQFEKYVPVTRLKYYFAVDNNYVVKKLLLLLFPFTQRDWSVRYDHDNPVQPRYDLNAPDLYIPTMAYITYVVLAGLVMGMQNQFIPEQLGILSSSALAYTIFELIIYSITLYVCNLSTSMNSLDLVAYAGYKFVMIDICILVSILFKRFGYYSAFLYTSVSLCFFLLRTLKSKILRDVSKPTYDAYGNVQPSNDQNDYSLGRKRKLYLLFLMACLQPVLSFLLSWNLIPSKVVESVVIGAAPAI